MRLVEGGAPCPCGSSALFSACCGPYLGGVALAPTAEALMRSRYCAYVCRDTTYLLRTWDPAHRPPRLDLKDDRTQWLGLRILASRAGGPTDTQGEVEFIARFRHSNGESQLHERSRFRREGQAWLYVDGDLKPARSSPQLSQPKGQPVFSQPSVGRNDPCPCGSGKKWKRCCGM